MTNVFKESDYNSNDGMVTNTWGAPLWHSLHTMSFNYPVNPTNEQKQEYFAFFTSLKWVLPCKYCRDNYVKNLEELPLNTRVLSTRSTFSRWLYDMHNLVNKRLKKPIVLTYEQVRDRYENFRARCIVENKKEVNSEIEKGCTVPLYGKKAKAIIHIVPVETVKGESIIISEETKLKIK